MSLSLDPFAAPFLDDPLHRGLPAEPRVLYIDVDDDLPGLLDRVEEAGTPAIVVLPEGARAIRGMVAARLLQRRADAAGIPLLAVTTDRTAIAQLRGVHIPTASTVGEARRLLAHHSTVSSPVDVVDDVKEEDDTTEQAPARLTAVPVARATAPEAPEDLDPEEEAPFPAGTSGPIDTSRLPVASVRVARARSDGAPGAGGRRWGLWALGMVLLVALGVVVAWVVLFPQATIVISYTATSVDRSYRIVAVAGSAQGTLPVHATHLDVSGTLTVPATGTTELPYGHATGSITFANPLDGYVHVPVGTVVGTGDGITFVTLASIDVPRAEHSFSGTTNGQQNVQVEAIQPGPGSNVAAGAITRIQGRLAGTLLITNYAATGGGTLRTVYTITQQDTAGAVSTLRTRLTARAERTLRQRFAHSPARTITGVSAGTPRVTSVTGNGRLYAKVSLTVRVTMNYLHAQDVRRVAAARGALDLSAQNLTVVAGTEHETMHVAPEGARFVLTVQVHARVVPAIDTTNLRGLLVGRSVSDARQLLDGSARYGRWRYTLQTNPNWAGRMPQAPSLIHIAVRQIG